MENGAISKIFANSAARSSPDVLFLRKYQFLSRSPRPFRATIVSSHLRKWNPSIMSGSLFSILRPYDVSSSWDYLHGIFLDQSTRGSIALLIIANRARGMTTFTLHPCHLSPPIHPRLFFVHSPIPFCITPKGRSPRLFPLQAAALVCSLCTTSRLLLLLLTSLLFFLLLRPPSLSLSLSPSLSLSFSPSSLLRFRLRLSSLRSVSPCLEMRFSFCSLPFLPALRSPPSSPVAPFVFVERTRRRERRKMCARGIESTRERKREENYEQRERRPD